MTVGLEAQDLWFRYPDGPEALRGVTLRIEGGEYVALIGLNGSGKTSLAKQFNGLLRPGRGRVRVDGADTGSRSIAELARQVGYAFQNPDHQIFSPTVRDELAFGPRNLGASDAEVSARVEALLERFQLGPVADRPPALLGHGQRRKIALAAVLAMQTPALILDEPTAGLDAASVNELFELLDELHQGGRTIVLITHDLRRVAERAPRCLVLDQGQLHLDGPTRTILADAEGLAGAGLAPPAVPALCRRLTPLGFPPDRLTATEFCTAYADRILAHREGHDAGGG